jgi:aryl-alcohol dehydrogenase-like predicted oxidoreductase
MIIDHNIIPWSSITRGILIKPLDKSSLRNKIDDFIKILFLDKIRESKKIIINTIEVIIKKRDISMIQVIITWILSKEDILQLWIYLIIVISISIIGLNSEERIKDIIIIINLKLMEEEKKQLEESYISRSITGYS